MQGMPSTGSPQETPRLTLTARTRLCHVTRQEHHQAETGDNIIPCNTLLTLLELLLQQLTLLM